MNTKLIAAVASIVIAVALIIYVVKNPSSLVMPEAAELTQVYQDAEHKFSIRYPEGFTVDEKYQYQNMGPGKAIDGTKFTIPTAMATGTNLSLDSYVSVEHMSTSTPCEAARFLEHRADIETIQDMGVTYSVASSSDAAAGNRYEETVYVLPQSSLCLAVRYFIHYGAYENYPGDSIKEFDEEPGSQYR